MHQFAVYFFANTTILGIDLYPGTFEFAGATPYPDFRQGGQQFINAFVDLAMKAEEVTR